MSSQQPKPTLEQLKSDYERAFEKLCQILDFSIQIKGYADTPLAIEDAIDNYRLALECDIEATDRWIDDYVKQ